MPQENPLSREWKNCFCPQFMLLSLSMLTPNLIPCATPNPTPLTKYLTINSKGSDMAFPKSKWMSGREVPSDVLLVAVWTNGKTESKTWISWDRAY
mmetsp:Transcript_9387/g.34812  ORF Transcript_9387/g.34812 Transcript_9387/m.34812 type:complete len:96 (-) Transcript_9387:1332-1619(-)